MDIGKDKLRMLFKAETDLDITKKNLPQYVKWLEKVKIIDVVHDIAIESRNLKDSIQKAMDVLDDGISSRHTE
ncbi:MAG: hypothetical protein OCD02_11210 [Spirochaetaceae bacterium]